MDKNNHHDQTTVSLRRMALDDKLYGELAALSKTIHIPMQDLIGGAVDYCLSLDQHHALNWRARARECLNRRLQEKS